MPSPFGPCGALALALLLAGCSASQALGEPDTTLHAPPPQLGAAEEEPAARLGELRILSSKVNLREPVRMGALDGEVAITFAIRGRRGVTVALAPRSFVPRLVTPFVYPESPVDSAFPHPVPSTARLALRRGTLECWTEEGSHRLLANVPDRGQLVISERAMDVVGPPYLASADGEHVLIAFFAATGGLFQLHATWLDVP